jgi:hypothetical protein
MGDSIVAIFEIAIIIVILVVMYQVIVAPMMEDAGTADGGQQVRQAQKLALPEDAAKLPGTGSDAQE